MLPSTYISTWESISWPKDWSSYGHIHCHLQKVRRNPFAKSFLPENQYSILLNTHCVNCRSCRFQTVNNDKNATSAKCRFLNYRLTIHSQTTLAQMRILRIPKIVGYYIICWVNIKKGRYLRTTLNVYTTE